MIPLPLNKNVRLLAEHPCGIFALEKPAGTMTHPNAPGVAAAKRAMLVADYSLKQECYLVRVPGCAGTQKIYVLNRLDSPTSGVVLCSTNEQVARLARQAFETDKVKKIYYAVVVGNAPTKAFWRDDLIREKTRPSEPLRVVIAPRRGMRGAQEAVCEIRRMGGNAKAALVKLLPHTGRTHQLRVQCAGHRLPIVGDENYGITPILPAGVRPRLFLHAAETAISFPWQGVPVNFFAESPLPEDFSRVADFLAR
ncbi:MAG: RNA pseudouridine synthase [Opitutales bacterium]|nr:RNA pseudouridine synthase [Opitutales bacterium]